MSAINNDKKGPKKGKQPVNTSTTDYSQDPFFVKKNERAAEVIKKYGIPKHLLKKSE